MIRSASFLATSHETSAAILILALPSPMSVSSKVVATSLPCPLMVVRSGHSKQVLRFLAERLCYCAKVNIAGQCHRPLIHSNHVTCEPLIRRKLCGFARQPQLGVAASQPLNLQETREFLTNGC